MKKKNKYILTFSLITGSIGIASLASVVAFQKYNNNKISTVKIYDINNNYLGEQKVKSGSILEELISKKEIEKISLIDKQLKNGKKIDYSFVVSKKENNYIQKDFSFFGNNEIVINFLNVNDISLKQNFIFNIPSLENKVIENYSKALKQIIGNLLRKSNICDSFKIFSSYSKQESYTQIKVTIFNFIATRDYLKKYLVPNSNNKYKSKDILKSLNSKKEIFPNINFSNDISYLNFEIIQSQNDLFEKNIEYEENDNIIDINLEYDLNTLIEFYQFDNNINESKLFLTKKYSFKNFESFLSDYVDKKINLLIPNVSQKNNFRNLYYYEGNNLINLNDTFYKDQNIKRKLQHFWEFNQLEKKKLYTDNKFDWIEFEVNYENNPQINNKKFVLRKEDNQAFQELFNSIKNKYYFDEFHNKTVVYRENDLEKFKTDFLNVDQKILFSKYNWLEEIQKIELINVLNNESKIVNLDFKNNRKNIDELSTLNQNELFDYLKTIMNNNVELVNSNLNNGIQNFKWDIVNAEIQILNNDSKLIVFVQRKKPFVLKNGNDEMHVYLKDNEKTIIDNEYILNFLKTKNHDLVLSKAISKNYEQNPIIFKYKENEPSADWLISKKNKKIEIVSNNYLTNDSIKIIDIITCTTLQKYHVKDKNGIEYWINIPYFIDVDNNNEKKIDLSYIPEEESIAIEKLLKNTSYAIYKDIKNKEDLFAKGINQEDLYNINSIEKEWHLSNLNNDLLNFDLRLKVDLNSNTVNILGMNFTNNYEYVINGDSIWIQKNPAAKSLIEKNYKDIVNSLLNNKFNFNNTEIKETDFNNFEAELTNKLQTDEYYKSEDVNTRKRDFMFKYSENISFSYSEYNDINKLSEKIFEFLKALKYNISNSSQINNWITESMQNDQNEKVIKNLDDARNTFSNL